MTHVRWVNQMLWELYRHGRSGQWKYEPVVRISETVRMFKPQWTGLCPLSPKVLDEFIDTERPEGRIDAAYARCIATLSAVGYPKEALELAKRIDGEGYHHFYRFLEVKRMLSAYAGSGIAYPYLRPVEVAHGNEADDAKGLFHQIIDLISRAYASEATDNYGDAETKIAEARRTMMVFKGVAEELAKKGIGVPFLDDPALVVPSKYRP